MHVVGEHVWASVTQSNALLQRFFLAHAQPRPWPRVHGDGEAIDVARPLRCCTRGGELPVGPKGMLNEDHVWFLVTIPDVIRLLSNSLVGREQRPLTQAHR